MSDPRRERLARWTSREMCVDVFAEDDPGEWHNHFYALADAALARLTDAAARGSDVVGVLATDPELRRVLVCSCEHDLHGPWTEMTPERQHLLRLRAARCVGACDLAATAATAGGP